MTDEETCYEFGEIQYEIEIAAPRLPCRRQSFTRRLAAAENNLIALQRAIEHHCAGVSPCRTISPVTVGLMPSC